MFSHKKNNAYPIYYLPFKMFHLIKNFICQKHCVLHEMTALKDKIGNRKV